MSGGLAQLAKGSIISPRDLGSNLGLDRIFTSSLYAKIEFKFVS
jgi:hypothetical protein